MPSLLKKSNSAQIEADFGRLQQKLADHQRRRSEALQALAEAQTSRRQVLADEQDVIDQHSAKVRTLTIEAEDLATIISEYEIAIADAEARLRDARTQETRRAEADRRETGAAKVEALAPDLQKGVLSVAKTAKAMTAAIADLGVFPAYYAGRPDGRPETGNDLASGREAVAAVIAEALLNALPEIFDMCFRDQGYHASLSRIMTPTASQPSFYGDGADYKALAPEAAVAALITSRLRERAAEILAGEVEPPKTTVAIVTPFRRPDPPAELSIVALKNFRFVDGEPGFKPRYRPVGEGEQVTVREAVARHAIAAGAAALAGSDTADDLLEAIRNKRTARAGFGPAIEDYADIGDALGLQKEWERSKLEFVNVERDEVARALG